MGCRQNSLIITKVAEPSLPHPTGFWILWRGKSAENSIVHVRSHSSQFLWDGRSYSLAIVKDLYNLSSCSRSFFLKKIWKWIFPGVVYYLRESSRDLMLGQGPNVCFEMRLIWTARIQMKSKCDHHSCTCNFSNCNFLSPKKNSRASTGFEPMASGLALKCSNNWAMETQTLVVTGMKREMKLIWTAGIQMKWRCDHRSWTFRA